jgi:uncharacterized protein (DUF488 family)
MLNRQKSLLYMIEQAGRPVTHLEMTKWAFVLAHETPSRGGTAFYQFLPYQRGPFSFCLYREIDGLVDDGYLVDEDKAWRVVEGVERPTGGLAPSVREDAACVVRRFRDKDSDTLTNYVYQRFPWYTVNGAARKLQSRPVAPIAVFTVGYEGWLVDGFLNLLLRAGVQHVIDVRSNPVARRYGFHKCTLDRLCGKVQIKYSHFPQLGISSNLRHGLETASQYEALFSQYEANVLPREEKAVAKVAALMRERPTVLMCMETNPSKCHRSRLATAIARLTALAVHHLGDHDESGI